MTAMLDTMTFPLHGARLIEASAGTGKTFTIAGLYLRLLLGHGSRESKHSVPLTVDQILVVTFTEAATAELRDRIRRRIHDARIAFLRNKSTDPVIAPLLSAVTDHSWAAQTLLDAERQMDEAAVFTIHGFCQRMLTQNAFESGSRFSNEFVTDESKLKAQVVCDYWRSQFYSLPMHLALEVRSLWSSPDALLKEVGRYLTGVPVKLTVKAMLGDLETLHQENLDKIEKFKAEWLESCDEIASLILESDVSKRSFTKKNLPNWLNEIEAWARSETSDYRIPDKLTKFSVEFLTEKTPEGKKTPVGPVFDKVSQFLATPPTIREPLLAHAIEACRQRLEQTKQQKQWLSFDDLLTHLSVAIDIDEQSLLTDRIRALYPVAMIDEFQDTDPLQYSIFSRIYLNSPESGLFMIGDPKQAIYAFRGADIFTYIRARNEVVDHYTLGINWRSGSEMVTAVNRIFEHADSPFMYDQDIPFTPVSASPNAEKRSWWLGEQKQPAMNYWLMEAEEPLAKGDYVKQMSVSTAVQVKSVLQSAKKNKGYFVTSSGNKKQIQAGDIAVLVRTGTEAQKIRQELSQLGVASVYLSNRDSVFSSAIATAIQRILRAVLNPENERALRAALASDLLMQNSQDLDDLNISESKLEEQIYRFQEYRKIWKQRGVMPMLRAIMSRQHIAENLLTQEFGDRALTDYLHLSELLQQASLTLESDHALLRWFSEQIQEANSGESGAADDQIQRLESEKNLVQIVTIHKSKGLEYELVFLPFITAYREAQSGKYYDEQQKETILDITGNASSIAQADKERLAEDLRLLYVAVTRAVYGCFIGLAPLRRGRSRKEPSAAHLSAIGYLLQNGQPASCDGLNQSLNQLIASADSTMAMQALPETEDLHEQMDLFGSDEFLGHSKLKDHHDLKARILKSEIDRKWRITSYSGLVKQSHSKASVVDVFDVVAHAQGLDIDSSEDEKLIELEEQQRSIFTFPRGARAGTFLHTLFEKIDFTLPATSEETTRIILDALALEQYELDWLPVLQKLVHDVLTTNLDGESMQLSEKSEQHKLVEMEFLLPIKLLLAPQLNQLVCQHDDLSVRAGDLGFQTVQGMLKGFIDLIFEHKGKYYVLDWKSNHLGDDTSAYTKLALDLAMIDHRYDLQYQIYSLALHRYLGTRIANYSYEKHFGGAYYIFLRGIENGESSGIFYRKPTETFLDQLDALIDGLVPEDSYA